MIMGGESKPSRRKPHSSFVDGIHRAPHDLDIALFEPSRCRVQKFPGDGTIGKAFEEAEKTGLFIMDVDVVAVDDRCDPADRFSVPARKETGGFGVLEKGVLLFAQEEFYFALERRDPVGISLVHFPRETDEFVYAPRTVDLFDVHELPHEPL